MTNVTDITSKSAAVEGPMMLSTTPTYTEDAAWPANMAVDRMESA